MGFIEFLNTLQNTLEEIEVRGKNNVSAMNACMEAIDEMRSSIIASVRDGMKQQAMKPENGGDEVGGQSDIGTDSGNNSNNK